MFIKSSKYQKIIKLLKLDKPLVIFDIETTGGAISKDKIIEIAYLKICGNGKIIKDDIIFDPEIKISPESTAIHGIKNQDLKGKQKFRERAQEIWEVFNDCYYAGYNIINFDLLILRREFIRVGMDFNYNTSQVIDIREIYHYLVPQTISSAFEYYHNKKFTLSHSAANHAEATADILIKQLEKYKDMLNREFINKIHQFEEYRDTHSTRKFYWLHGEAYFAFSKYKDQPLSKIVKKDPKFLEWILMSDFKEETKTIVKRALTGNLSDIDKKEEGKSKSIKKEKIIYKNKLKNRKL